MLSALFAAECPTSLVRELRDADPRSMPARLWKSLADAGVFGLLLPQEYGGAGGTLSDLGIFCLEAGRGLCPTIVHGTVQAALAIQTARRTRSACGVAALAGRRKHQCHNMFVGST